MFLHASTTSAADTVRRFPECAYKITFSDNVSINIVNVSRASGSANLLMRNTAARRAIR